MVQHPADHKEELLFHPRRFSPFFKSPPLTNPKSLPSPSLATPTLYDRCTGRLKIAIYMVSYWAATIKRVLYILEVHRNICPPQHLETFLAIKSIQNIMHQKFPSTDKKKCQRPNMDFGGWQEWEMVVTGWRTGVGWADEFSLCAEGIQNPF